MCRTRVRTPALIAAVLLWFGSEVPAGPAQDILLNEDWSFTLEDAAPPETGGSASTAWIDVDLPHTWNAADSRNKERPYHRGSGRYRKSLVIEPRLAGKRLYLYFEGANQVAEVAVNGRPAGRHVGGYSAFAFDVSDLVRIDEENEIEVRLDNRHDEDVPPLNADFTFYGGIYRDVRLLALEEVHFGLDDYAAREVRIVADPVSEARAAVRIDAGIANDARDSREVHVESTIADTAGAVVARGSVSAELAAGTVTPLRLGRFEVENPALWSPESPQLYRVTCTIRDDSGVLDRVTYPLGLRWLELDAERGFRLNGRPYRLFGSNRHQDYPGLGNALPDALHRRDLEIIKDNGFNFVRLAHYPQDPAVLETADEIGLLVWEEIPIVNLIGLSGEFRDNSTRMLKEMIRQHRHHPSVIFWGYMNEVTLVDPKPMPADYHEEVIELAKHLQATVHEEDPSRPTAMALSRDELGKAPPLQAVPDVVAFNLYFGWYYEELESLGSFLDDYHARHPDRPMFVSEYGAGSDERIHALEPEPFDFSTEYQQRFHEAAFSQILERPWLVGSAVWAQFDFGSDYRHDTKFGLNQKGLHYYDRSPKDVAWLYKARLDDEPVLHIAAGDWRRRAGSRSADAIMPVDVYSNEPSVELSVNGVSLGSRPVRGAVATWDISFAPGENRLAAHSANREDEVTVHYEDRRGFFDSGSATGALLVNAGGGEQFIDGDGRIWEADREYREGSWGHIGGEAERSHHRIYDTEDDPLYQTRRRAPHSWRFDVPDGHYRVGLRFAQLGNPQPGPSRFTVDVNGEPHDIGPVPPFTRRDVDVETAVTAGDGLVLRLPDGPDEPYLNGIVVERRTLQD